VPRHTLVDPVSVFDVSLAQRQPVCKGLWDQGSVSSWGEFYSDKVRMPKVRPPWDGGVELGGSTGQWRQDLVLGY
jgi:hypothetical protein